MRSDVRRDMSRSSQLFVRDVWPVVEPLLGGGRYVPVEGADNQGLAQALDALAGIDGFQVIEEKSAIRGIATRVQWIKAGMYPFNTFSIRLARPTGSTTEKEKRIAQINGGAKFGILYPHITVQAYFRDQSDELLSVGVIATVDLYTCVQKHPSNVTKIAGNGGEQFEVCSFEYLKDKGYPVKVWTSPKLTKPTGRILINGVEQGTYRPQHRKGEVS